MIVKKDIVKKKLPMNPKFLLIEIDTGEYIIGTCIRLAPDDIIFTDGYTVKSTYFQPSQILAWRYLTDVK